MKEHKLNLKFNSLKECELWEKEHFTDNGRTYNGETILMVNHDENIYSDEVMLVSIYTV